MHRDGGVLRVRSLAAGRTEVQTLAAGNVLLRNRAINGSLPVCGTVLVRYSNSTVLRLLAGCSTILYSPIKTLFYRTIRTGNTSLE